MGKDLYSTNEFVHANDAIQQFVGPKRGKPLSELVTRPLRLSVLTLD